MTAVGLWVNQHPNQWVSRLPKFRPECILLRPTTHENGRVMLTGRGYRIASGGGLNWRPNPERDWTSRAGS